MTSNDLGTTVDAMRSTQFILPPPTQCPPLSLNDPARLPKFGSNVLVVIPTGNNSKKQCIQDVIPHTTPEGDCVRFFTIEADSNVGEQPYNEAGVEGARNRIQNVLAALKSPEYRDCLQEWAIGTVIVACIESFIQTDNVDHPTDYGVLVFYNASSQQSVTAMSKGITVPEQYLDRARRFGVEGNPNYGRVTVGRILAANVPGLDKADWHSVLAGRSRYDLLKEAARGLQIPW